MAIEVYRIINKESPSYLEKYLHVKTTRYGPRSFRFFASKLWNELRNYFRLQTSFNQFKTLNNSWKCSSCHCNVRA